MKKSIKELSPQLRNRAALKRYQQGGISKTGFSIKQDTGAGFIIKDLPDELRKQKHLRQAKSFEEVPKQYYTKLESIVEDIQKFIENSAVIEFNDSYYLPKLNYGISKAVNYYYEDFDDYKDSFTPLQDNTTFIIGVSITPKLGKLVWKDKKGDRKVIPHSSFNEKENFSAHWYYEKHTDSKPILETKMRFLKDSKIGIPSSVTNKLIRFLDTLKVEIVKNPKSDKLKDTSYSDWANADDKDKYLETKLTNKMKLNENQEEILKKILRNIDKYIQRTGKGQKHVNDLRSKIEAKLMAINPNVTKSSAMKTFKGTFDKQNESTLLELSDIERLLEYIKEADKKDSPKSKPKSKADSDTPKKEDEEISPSAALQKFKKSSGASNLMQDLRRMSSKSERATAIIQLMKSLPGISDTTIRRAIVNAFKTKG